jgi:hypothetical protein
MSQNLISSTISYSILVYSELLMTRPHVSKYQASTVKRNKEIIYIAQNTNRLNFTKIFNFSELYIVFQNTLEQTQTAHKMKDPGPGPRPAQTLFQPCHQG